MKFKNKNTGTIIDWNCVQINSSLLSAQNRKRLYWSNINITQPKDKGIVIKDILQNSVDKMYYISFSHWKESNHSNKLIHKVGNIYPSGGQNGNIYDTNFKSPTILSGIGIAGSGIGSNNSPKILVSNNPLTIRKLTPVECERLQCVPDNYSSSISDTQRYKVLGNCWTVDIIASIFYKLRKIYN